MNQQEIEFEKSRVQAMSDTELDKYIAIQRCVLEINELKILLEKALKEKKRRHEPS